MKGWDPATLNPKRRPFLRSWPFPAEELFSFSELAENLSAEDRGSKGSARPPSENVQSIFL